MCFFLVVILFVNCGRIHWILDRNGRGVSFFLCGWYCYYICWFFLSCVSFTFQFLGYSFIIYFSWKLYWTILEVKMFLLAYVIFASFIDFSYLFTGKIWQSWNLNWILLKLYESLFFSSCGYLIWCLFGYILVYFLSFFRV